jgi:hypothetical protein
MDTLLAFFRARKWLGWLLLALAVVGGLLYVHHRIFDEGIEAQKAKDTQAYLQQLADAHRQTQQAQARAANAEANYDREKREGEEYRRNHPFTNADMLCSAAPIVVTPSVAVSRIGQGNSRDAQAAPAAELGNPMRGPDTPVPPTRLRLLNAVAALLDDQSAVIREYQNRETPHK